MNHLGQFDGQTGDTNHLTAILTVINYHGMNMGKVYWHEQGTTKSRTDGNGYVGTFRVVEFRTMAELSILLDRFEISEIYVQGVPRWPDARIGYVYTNEVPFYVDETQDWAVRRTKEDFTDAPLGIATMDSDMDWAPRELSAPLTTPSEFFHFLLRTIPELEGVGLLVRPSGSNGITNPDGTPFKDSRNYHTAFKCYGEERYAILERLFGLLVLRGCGWFMISESGGLLERSPIDRSLRIQNQPVFAAPPRVEHPVIDNRPAPVAVEGRVLRLADLPEVNPETLAAVLAELKSDPALRQRQAQIKYAYQKKQARAALAASVLPTPQQMREAIAHQRKQAAMRDKAELHGEPLPLEFEIHTVRHGVRTVADLLDQREFFHGALTKDPMEPDYRGGAQTGKLYLNGHNPMLTSLAHGRLIKYRLQQPEPKYGFDLRTMTICGKPVVTGLDAGTAPGENAPVELEASDARQRLADAVGKWFLRGGKVGIRATMGLGKTTLVARLLVENRNRYYLFLLPTVQKAREAFEAYCKAGGTEGYVYLGRRQPHPENPNVAMCTDLDHADWNLNFGTKGTSLCAGCPRFRQKQCGYDVQREWLGSYQPRVVFAVHEFAHVPLPGWEPDRVIIDESLRNGGVDLSISTPSLSLVGLPNEPTKEQIEERLLAHQRTIPDFDEASRLAHRHHALVLEAMRDRPECIVRMGGNVIAGQKLEYLHKEKDTLVLDGTMRRKLTEIYLGQLDEVVHIDAKRNGTLTQVIGKQMGIRSLLSSGEQKVRETLLQLAEGFEGKICEKKVRGKLGKVDDMSWAHFGALRGMNTFEAFNTLIIFGYRQPPVAAMVAIASLLLGEKIKGKEVDEQRYLKLRDGGGRQHCTTTKVHTNELVTELIRAHREDELAQAVDRLRMVWHEGEPKRVVLVTPVVLDLLIDEVVEWLDFKAGRAEHRLVAAVRAEGGEMCLSKRQLVSKYPTLYASQSTAERDLKAAQVGEISGVSVIGTGPRGVKKLKLLEFD